MMMDLTETYIGICETYQELPPELLRGLVAYIEREYEMLSDTDLGDFLNELMKLCVVARNDDLLHQHVQDILDEYEDLNEEMLLSVGSHLQTLGTKVLQHSQA